MIDSLRATSLITTRDDVGELWLPWCVRADDPAMPLEHFPARQVNAAQLRVSGLDTEVIQVALAKQCTPSGETSWPKITAFAKHFSDIAANGSPAIVDAPAPETPALMKFGDFTMVCEGCHRACALWVARIPDFELRAVRAALVWPEYANQELRLRGRPFAGP
jgi:hypothetical protein